MSQEFARLLAEHGIVSRRYLLGLGAAGAAALGLLPLGALADEKSQSVFARACRGDRKADLSDARR